ncbi:MAG: TetR/AcrR family transcriptional regulator [Pseudohongiella sp.]|nr:TetR/AcrR family transcriptional regulator [Pseudohongiella sp.]MDP2127513.1 TetR/AcrR family transcriptional regulator [Pseudohongiella sp.]
MTLKSRREMEKLERHEEILDAAELVFFKKSYEQTTMDDIARAARLSRALLYVYFTDKPSIMRGIMLRAGNSLQVRFEKTLQLFKTGLEQIEGIGHAYHAFSEQEPNYFDVLTSITTFPGPDTVDEQLLAMDRCRERVNEIMVEALENGIRDGSISPEQVPNPLQTAFYLQGALHGVIMQTRGPKSAQTNYPAATELILYTISMLTLSVKTLKK